ncbi:MAG: hypothetical protein J6N21_11080 [Butyrivibrio sp.]|uniref:Uncharacterized protein n=1 Tax=Butyrivibrio fibrisolvens TaxID=831 RepID=A0A1H9VGX6_BUTFI|nr:hypothetical protein [Butyrivibrio fibrisolvens]MBP3197532.1 hypothetical protein [Butyrivibrio sp.]SES21060.1 hypothetical protein SAMN04487884_12337 [Butyrivibrio fibrisolvens]
MESMEESAKREAIKIFINSRKEKLSICNNEQLIGLARLVDCYLCATPKHKRILAKIAVAAKHEFPTSDSF